jgi:hypothetical protein
MTADEVRAIALAQPGAVEGAHHNHPDFRVGKSIFATLCPDECRSVLRLPEPFAASLEAEDPDTFKIVSHGGGQGWTSVDLDRISEERFRPLMETAYDHLLAQKRLKSKK